MKGPVTVSFLSLVLLATIVVRANAQRKPSYYGDAGIAKITGEGSEYWKMGFSVGGAALFPLTTNISLGGRLGYAQFSPDEDKLKEDVDIPSGMSVDVSGSISSIEILTTMRYTTTRRHSGGPVFFVQGSIGYYFLTVKYKVSASYMGYSESLSDSKTENKPGIGIGAGVIFGTGTIFEMFPVYNVIFTENEATKYLALNFGVAL